MYIGHRTGETDPGTSRDPDKGPGFGERMQHEACLKKGRSGMPQLPCKVESVIRQGQGVCNEDALLLAPEEGLFGVIDGVSGLTAYRDAQGRTAGHIASTLVAACFAGAGKADLERTTLEANARLHGEMERLEGQGRSEDTGIRWGAVHAVVRVDEDRVAWVQSGDCMVYAVYEDGVVRAVTRDSVEPHDERALALWRREYPGEWERRVQPPEVTEALRENRRRANRPGGYSVINGDDALGWHLESGNIARSGLAHLLLVTDGIYPWREEHRRSTEEWVREVIGAGLEAYVDELEAFEEDDPECRSVQRFKRSDDKTGILLSFSKESRPDSNTVR
ncbi:protein phosphatase 2C domain-containing protein [Paenibacillus chitinolyticus]|uniref:protein phosphatase 2C domain-containing protein n=1 Tax=Paenibacillus chitinolyticus TaxID=79263 RepID=UPI003D03F070